MRSSAVVPVVGLLLLSPLPFAASGCVGRVQGADAAAERAVDAQRAGEYAAVAGVIVRDPRGAIPSINRLIRSEKDNGLAYYLRAAVAARQGAWRSAHYLLEQGNKAPHLVLYVDPATKKLDAATLTLLRGLAEDCARVAPDLEGDVDGEALLWECAGLARRLSEQAEPKGPELRAAGAQVRVVTEGGRALRFEKQGRFADADDAYRRKREGEKVLASIRRETARRAQVASR